MNRAIVSEDKVRLGFACRSKWDAIAAAGELLVRAGHVAPGYPDFMVAREKIGTTYIGNGVAIPHATRAGMASVLAPGVSIVQIPDGVDFGGESVRLVLGLAACDSSHLELLTHIAAICADDAQLERLIQTTSPAEVVSTLQLRPDESPAA